MTVALESNIPPGPIADKWDEHKFSIKLVNPANKRRFHVLVVGTGRVAEVLLGKGLSLEGLQFLLRARHA